MWHEKKEHKLSFLIVIKDLKQITEKKVKNHTV